MHIKVHKTFVSACEAVRKLLFSWTHNMEGHKWQKNFLVPRKAGNISIYSIERH
jgi:hypothetical protein